MDGPLFPRLQNYCVIKQYNKPIRHVVAQAHRVVSKPIRNSNFINRQWPLASHCACAHDISIRPIQVEVTLYLGQTR